MTTCQYRLLSGVECGKPAVVVWTHVMTGKWHFCHEHDHKAMVACYRDSFLSDQWDRFESPDAPQAQVPA